MKKIVMLILGFALALALALPASAVPVKNLNCDGFYDSGTYRNVTVEDGGNCTLAPGVTVLGGVHAKKGAENLYVEVATGRNIQAMGVTDTVYVGPGPDAKGNLCTYDPPVGNNLMVKKSHNVLICYAHAGNNIYVTGNDGCITVRDSIAENNLTVSRNKKFTGSCNGAHRRPEAIRVLRNAYGNHLKVAANAGRPEIVKGNGVYAD